VKGMRIGMVIPAQDCARDPVHLSSNCQDLWINLFERLLRSTELATMTSVSVQVKAVVARGDADGVVGAMTGPGSR